MEILLKNGANVNEKDVRISFHFFLECLDFVLSFSLFVLFFSFSLFLCVRQKWEGIDKDLRGEEREDEMNTHKHRLKERKEVDEECRSVMKETETE